MRSPFTMIVLAGLVTSALAQAPSKDAIQVIDAAGRTLGRLNGDYVLVSRAGVTAWVQVHINLPNVDNFLATRDSVYFSEEFCGGTAHVKATDRELQRIAPPGPLARLVQGPPPGNAKYLYVPTGALTLNVAVRSAFGALGCVDFSPQSYSMWATRAPIDVTSAFTEPLSLR